MLIPQQLSRQEQLNLFVPNFNKIIQAWSLTKDLWIISIWCRTINKKAKGAVTIIISWWVQTTVRINLYLSKTSKLNNTQSTCRYLIITLVISLKKGTNPCKSLIFITLCQGKQLSLQALIWDKCIQLDLNIGWVEWAIYPLKIKANISQNPMGGFTQKLTSTVNAVTQEETDWLVKNIKLM